jgi:hypothetical protein
MEAMLGISLYSYPYLNSQKYFVFLIIAYDFSSKQNWRKGQNRSCLEVRGGGGWRGSGEQGGEMTQTMYAHMTI